MPVIARNLPSRSGSAAMKPSAVIASSSAAALCSPPGSLPAARSRRGLLPALLPWDLFVGDLRPIVIATSAAANRVGQGGSAGNP